jgi:RimJ/RimL family protein N-acetyltransferase
MRILGASSSGADSSRSVPKRRSFSTSSGPRRLASSLRPEFGSSRGPRNRTGWTGCTPWRSRQTRTSPARSACSHSSSGSRAAEIEKPSRRPELCFIALAGDEVVGYAALHVFGEEAFHGLTATRRDWRRRGVAAALKRAEIAAAKRAGFRRPLTESEERNEPMRRLNEKLGFVPAPELSTLVMRGPVS